MKLNLVTIVEYIKAYKNQGPKVINPKSNPEGYIGTRVAKYFFGTDLYFGSVKKYNKDGGYWWIEYDDGDGEEDEVERERQAEARAQLEHEAHRREHVAERLVNVRLGVVELDVALLVEHVEQARAREVAAAHRRVERGDDLLDRPRDRARDRLDGVVDETEGEVTVTNRTLSISIEAC